MVTKYHFFKSKSGERKEQITIFLTASIYWLIGSQNVAPKGETTDSSKSKTDNTTLYTQWNKPRMSHDPTKTIFVQKSIKGKPKFLTKASWSLSSN